ncbi:hypothetical protein MKW98_031024 [Papaver atlanticum]|uniref:Calpain-type cysteine protease DEK1 n=1 Tax=Papaver atlanticum TaxID=357466 RepID=A0AAD4S6T4_9MAGN|nr:hypothetical protein MKW98_031024 [Papaver atlanticum]
MYGPVLGWSVKFAYSDCIEVGPVACLAEPHDPNELYPDNPVDMAELRELYCFHTLVVTAFKYLGHCSSYGVVASVLLFAAVPRHVSVMSPSAARRDALQSKVIRLREGFRQKGQNSSSSSSEGCGSSAKHSNSVEASNLSNGMEATCISHCTFDSSNWNNVVLGGTSCSHEGINSDKSIDSGRPSLALRSSSCRSVVQDFEVGMTLADKQLERSRYFVVCSSGGLESQGCESSTSTLANQQALDLNLAHNIQQKLTDSRVTAILERKDREGDVELADLLQNKGLDPNFAVMLKEKGVDPTILALMRRSSLDADGENQDNTDVTVIDTMWL